MKTTFKKPKPPSDLTLEAKRKWKEVRELYQIDDQVGLDYLTAAYRHWDRMREAQKLITEHGILISDRFGQQKLNPACVAERDASSAMLKCFRALNLDVGTPEKVGRPGKF